jgi:hypothetical protein
MLGITNCQFTANGGLAAPINPMRMMFSFMKCLCQLYRKESSIKKGRRISGLHGDGDYYFMNLS